MCGIVVTVEDGRAVKVRGDAEHPLSRGYICSKGRSLPAFTHGPDRLDHPTIDDVVTWDACLDDLASRIRNIVDVHGPDAVGLYLGVASAFDNAGRFAAEQFLAGLGSRSKYTSTSNDCPAKPIVSELMAGLSVIPILDTEHVTLTVMIGMNPVVSHGHTLGFPDPINRLRELTSDGREVWVLDPRRTETSALATRHLQLRPGSDHAVLAFAVRSLLADGADSEFLRDHARHVDELAAAVAPFTRERTGALSGIAENDLDDFVAAIRSHERVAVQSGTGATMHVGANATEWLSRALEVVTESADRRGGTLFNPGWTAALDKVGKLPTPISTKAPGPGSRPEQPSFGGEFPVSSAIPEIEAGNVRALFVLGGNPVTSFPDARRLTCAFEQLDVLAVADVAHTDTTAMATHVLPTTGPLERADTPHIDMLYPAIATQYTPAAVAPEADRKPAWWVFAALAERLGFSILPDALDADAAIDDDVLRMRYTHPLRTFEQVRNADGCIVDGLPEPGWLTENVLPDGRWDLAPDVLVEQLASLQDTDGIVLIARRQPKHLNSQLRTIAATAARPDEPDLLVHPTDAASFGIHEGDAVRVTSDSGSLTAHARLDDRLRPGAVSLPHGWAGREGPNVCELTSTTEHIDPVTGMIRQTALPVTITRLEEGPNHGTS